MIRTASIAFALLTVCCLAAAPVEARKKANPADSQSTDESDSGAPSTAKSKSKADKSKSDKAKSDTSGKPVQVATFGDWGAYLAKGKGKTCYTLASPKERKPDVKRAAAYVFIADRPADKVHNEVSIIMGFPLRDGGQAKVGTASFDLVAKGSNAWIKNPADEAKFIEVLRRSPKLVVKAAPLRGPATTDTYLLTGFKQALDRVTKECK